MKNVSNQWNAPIQHINTVPLLEIPNSPFGWLPENKNNITFLKECKPEHKRKKITDFHGIITGNEKMIELFDDIKNVAGYDFPVHIYGETGTGKELAAKAIHNHSLRANNPFVTVNCGALPEGILESELFGHERGAFSGAVKSRKGRFELASGGTLFLDEVAELSKSAQVKLLRATQEGTIEKVGGEKMIPINVRVISATNKIIRDEVNKGYFRKDLYYRLNVFPIALPALKNRNNDVIILAEHFIRKICRQYNKEPLLLSQAVKKLFREYDWPGNIRELQNAVSYAVVKTKDKLILKENLPLEFINFNKPPTEKNYSGSLSVKAVKEALIVTGWNKTKTAKKLDIGRATLYRFLQQHDELMMSCIK